MSLVVVKNPHSAYTYTEWKCLKTGYRKDERRSEMRTKESEI